MKMQFLIPATMALTLASGGAFAASSMPQAMTATHPAHTAANEASSSDRLNPKVTRHASCSALEARFDRDLARPIARTPRDVAEATTLRREGAALCQQTNARQGTVYLRSAIAVLVGHHRA